MRALLLGLALLLVACSEKAVPPACPPVEAAFRMQLTTESGDPLPRDTVVSVRYQGSQHETYSIADPPDDNEDVCCLLGKPTSGPLPEVSCARAVAPAGDSGTSSDAGLVDALGAGVDASLSAAARLDAGSDAMTSTDTGREPSALQCELWTNGIAEVTVTAAGYAELVQTLEAEAREDECGLQTVDERLVLSRQDAGR